MFRGLGAGAVLLSLATLTLTGQSNGKVDVWLTTSDRSSLLAEQHVPLSFGKSMARGPAIEVDDKSRFQTMVGFGFALTGGSAQLLMRMDAQHRSALLKELFETNGQAIGVSYLRISIGSSDMNEHVFTYDDMPAGEEDPQLTHFDLGPDRADVIPVLKEILAIHPKIAILASPWTAPSWMKTNGRPKGGSLRPELYPVYAQYFVKYIEGMAAEGIHLDAITVQNEPLNPKNTPSLVMSSQEQSAFIKSALGPALRKAGIKTKVILYDHNLDAPEYALDILADPEASQYVDGSGFHLYEGQTEAMSKVHEAHPEKNLYFTEQMVVDDKDGQFVIARPVSRIVIGATRNWSRNVLLWNLAADPHFGPHTDDGGCPVCEGAITLDGNNVTRNIGFYTIAQVAKFVRPGSVRIRSDASGVEGLANVAFETPDKREVLLVANTNHAAQTFSVRWHGKAFSATLGGDSVGTYIWR